MNPVPGDAAPSAQATVLRDVSWAAVWDPVRKRQTYAREVDIAFAGGRIVHAGPRYEAPPGQPVTEIDGRHRLVIPGLVDLHSHPHTEPAYKGIREDHGRAEMHGTGLYERSAAFRLSIEGRAAGAELAYGELLRGGVTTVLDLSTPFEGWVELGARSGLRIYYAPGFASARWVMRSLREIGFHWDEAAGRAAFERARTLIEEVDSHRSGRLSGVVFPAQIDTCTEALFRDAIAYAEETGRPITTHISQAVLEVEEMVRRHGMTPVAWAERIGLLGPRTILGHALFTDSHRATPREPAGDLRRIAESGATVAHCPSPFARYGAVLDHLGTYRDAGIRLGIGTDVAPHSLLEEMRLALVLARVASESVEAVVTADVFHAATTGGADALGREDLGRIAVGAAADLVIVDLRHPSMRPARDPVRTLVHEAAERAIEKVFVGGELVVDASRVLTLDLDGAAERLETAQLEMMSAVPQRDFLGRSARELAPLSLPMTNTSR